MRPTAVSMTNPARNQRPTTIRFKGVMNSGVTLYLAVRSDERFDLMTADLSPMKLSTICNDASALQFQLEDCLAGYALPVRMFDSEWMKEREAAVHQALQCLRAATNGIEWTIHTA